MGVKKYFALFSGGKDSFATAQEWSMFEGVKVWAPIFDWDTAATWRYVLDKGYERSPAYQTLCISGDCLCGAFATKMERAAIRAFYPTVFERIEWLEKKTGIEWGWGANKPTKRVRQLSPVCVDCEVKRLAPPDNLRAK